MFGFYKKIKNLSRITEIIKIEPYKITCRWTTGEIKVIDFKDNFDLWKKENNQTLLKLKDYNNFENITIKDGTLQWYSVMLNYTGLNGKQNKKPLELDPDNLYKQSKPISIYKLVLDTNISEKEYELA